MQLSLSAATLVCAAAFGAAARAQTITVDISSDTIDVDWQTATVADLPGPDGHVSFSEALIASNNTPGRQTVGFAIPPSDWQLQFLLPGRAVLRTTTGFFFRAYDEVTIDGTTQTAFTGDTNPGGGEVAIFGAELFLNAPHCTLIGFDSTSVQVTGDAGLVEGNTLMNITLFGGAGSMVRGNTGGTIKIDRSSDNVVIGNTVQRVRVLGWFGGGQPALNNRIGGPTLTERNHITGYGTWNSEGYPGGTTVQLFDTVGTRVENNWIGTTPDGLAQGNLASVVGVGFEGRNDDTLITGNRIAGILGLGQGPHAAGLLFGYGVLIGGSGSGLTITGNTIGLDANDQPSLGSVWGISIGDVVTSPSTMTDIRIGGAAPGEGNVIAGHRINGVTVGRNVAQVRLSGNSVHSNTQLGVDLVPTSYGYGVTLNDPLDLDTGGNGLQNFPTLVSADVIGAQTRFVGSLHSTPLSTFRVEFFASPVCDASGFGEGEFYLGGQVVTTNAAGDASIDAWTDAPPQSGWWATATATLEPLGATSEFSACVAIAGAPSEIFCTGGLAVGAPCPCSNSSSPAAQSGCVNSTGLGATLRSSGSTSVASDDLVLNVAQAPANVSSIVFMGASSAAPVPFSGGLRCIPPPAYRFSLTSSSALGAFALGPGIVAASQVRFPASGWIAAGSTWRFQAWFRDPTGPCGSANLSNGVALAFTP